jgi:bifunctional UDP-N-acetylglucosamine pyrophosphorylase / glucosamine-1-phosphate N-acetyltransferase
MAAADNTMAIVLAAGRGTRFQALSGNSLPKLLQPIQGKPLLAHVVAHIQQAGVRRISLVLGHKAGEVRSAIGESVVYVLQEQQLGSGHAVAAAIPSFTDLDGPLLIMCGDTPLVQPGTIRHMLEAHCEQGAVATLLTSVLEDPTGYGRVLRHSGGAISAVVEQKCAPVGVLRIREVNGGAYVFDARWLAKHISSLPVNAAGEINLTSAIELAGSEAVVVTSVQCEPEELLGVNTPDDLRRVNLLFADFQRTVHKREELLADRRRIFYYDFSTRASGSDAVGCRETLQGAANCPN